jgi:mRNA interferase HigB
VPFNVITRRRLQAFWKEHPESEAPLKAWYKLMKKGSYKNLNQLSKTFTVDYVRPKYYVFDIGGNKYRIVALVNFVGKRVLIDEVMTHADYDAWNKKR